MSVLNGKLMIPAVGERVKMTSLDGFEYGDCVTIEFESGKRISAHICDLPNLDKDKEKKKEDKGGPLKHEDLRKSTTHENPRPLRERPNTDPVS